MDIIPKGALVLRPFEAENKHICFRYTASSATFATEHPSGLAGWAGTSERQDDLRLYVNEYPSEDVGSIGINDGQIQVASGNISACLPSDHDLPCISIMPNYGRSGRCLTCKRRRVKCDEARPVCSPCRRLDLDCGGYTKAYTFRDISHKYVTRASSTRSPKNPYEGSPGRSLLNAADVAVPFFLIHYAGSGRRLTGGRGFYETLIPMYISQPDNSPLSLAISAVSARVFSIWRQEGSGRTVSYSNPYTFAIASLRSTLNRPEDRCRPATALAVLALHLYESISAVYDSRRPTPVHYHGALSLLPIAPLDSLDSLVNDHVQGFVLHTEISSALRQKRSLRPRVSAYLNDPSTPFPVPGNLSSILDSIGAAVAELQADYLSRLSEQQALIQAPEQHRIALIIRVRQLEDLLRAWARDVPDFWRPLRLMSGQDFCASIPGYQSACEIYPSCQIATLWNLWRSLHLVLLKVKIGVTPISVRGDDFVCEESLKATFADRAGQADFVRELVDGICYSVPFYLGNRMERSDLSNFTDPSIVFPSYHSLKLQYARISMSYHDWGDAGLSVDEHHRHLVAYGAWHVLSPMSKLLSVVSNDQGGRSVAGFFRAGQYEWIRDQLLRVGVLLGLPTTRFAGREKACHVRHVSMDAEIADTAAASLAKQVREGSRFMSGP